MNKLIYILFVLLFQISFGQDAFHNFGNAKIHDNGAIGFHVDVINDGTFDNNEGLAGFYNSDSNLTVSGSNRPIFKDMEIEVVDNLNLDVSVGVTNMIDYIDGLIITPRNDLNVNLDFLNNSIYFGENDNRHTDGYATVTGELDFKFPIGDDYRLRPLSVIPTNFTSERFQSAYFFEDPNSPSTFNESFNTDTFEPELSIISTQEYWDLNGTESTQAQLTWDSQSLIEILAQSLNDLRVVGFSINNQKWEDLGNIATTGNFETGTITSESFIPNEFEIITIGSVLKADGSVTIYDIITPNGDGNNDFLVIGGLEAFPDNELILYNRWGVEVYRKSSYDNSFNGISDGRATINQENILPVGTYYYVLKINGKNNMAGPFYINR
ncbi:gliding motility-associated C-terminal domain-containing protein [Patiriisocius marinus]|uniref:gliding motility-associated C-terminal domain-containing protein n=1 Tax=Patiriisocius marinus TaxID=1397112 RepID=UPI00232DC8A1|nr:gliding motility-associated C-terminal domain-containing protein [Patiriisocius marinus]